MEISELIDIYLLTIIGLIVLFCYHEFMKWWHFRRIGVTCERTWPLLGSLPTAMKQGILNHDMDGLRRYGKVYGTFLGTLPKIVVADPAYIREIFIKQFNKFPHRMQALYISNWWYNSVVMASGDHWRYMRSVITPAFSSGKLRQMQPHITQVLTTMTQTLNNALDSSSNGDVNIRKVLSSLTMDIVCNTSFGHQMNSLDNPDTEFSQHAKIVSTLNIASNPLNGLPLIIPATKRLFRMLNLDYVDSKSLNYVKDFVHKLIFSRRQNSQNQNNEVKDTLQNLMNAHGTEGKVDENGNNVDNSFNFYKQRGLTDDELIANALVVLMAGYDTTATTLTWMCYLLATNPNVQDRLVAAIKTKLGDNEPTYETVMNLDYLDWFLSETLRLFPAANRTGRDAVLDTDVLGTEIKAGMSITVPIYALHRLPEYWPEPDKCIPERFAPENRDKIVPYTYLPFGAGPRVCLGVRMAQMLCKMVTVKVLQNFKLSVSGKTELDPQLETSLLTKPKNGMILKMEKRTL